MSNGPVPVPAPSPDPCNDARHNVNLFKGKLGRLEQDQQQAQEALNQAKLEALAAVNYVDAQLAALNTDVLQTAVQIYQDLDEAARRSVDLLQRTLAGIPAFSLEDLPPYEELTNAAINLVDLIGDLIPIGMRVGAFAWGVDRATASMRAYEQHQVGLEAIKAERKVLEGALKAAEEKSEECRAANPDFCAVCQRAFKRAELRECQGCGALFCDAHYNEAIERHEVATGVSYTPG